MQLFKRQEKAFIEFSRATFADGHYERQLEDWITVSPHLVGELLLIGRQVSTKYGPIDLLALDDKGSVVVIELKRGKAPRDIMAQMNDYLRAVEPWDEAELQRNANLIPSSRFENTIVRKFQEHFNLQDPPPLNKEQWGILIAETIDDATIDRLGGSKYRIHPLEFSYFHKDGEEYVLINTKGTPEIETLPRTSNQGKDNNKSVGGYFTPQDIDQFFAYYERIHPILRNSVFPSDSGSPRGWSRGSSRPEAWVVYRMRKQRNIGFCIWMDERDRKSYCIGVYTSPRKFAAPLLSLLHANEDELRERLGANFRLDDANQDYPIWEHISKDDPEAVAKRLLIYRDTFVPYIDKILPPKETVK